MVPIVLALISAAAYGVSDFLGGIFAKRSSPWPTAVVGQTSSAVSVFFLALFLTGAPSTSDWWWAAAAGFGGGFGAAFLYRGLSSGRMAVVAPISAIGSALLPVGIGIAFGDRPGLVALVGIVVAFPAIYLISKVAEKGGESGGVVDGVLAGLGFGSLWALLGQVDAEAGMMPLVVLQVTAVLGVILTATVLRESWVPRTKEALWPIAMGPLGAIATGAFLYATHEGLLSIVSVIASLYPATTVLLAAIVLRERIHRAQGVGLLLAAIAVSLVAMD